MIKWKRYVILAFCIMLLSSVVDAVAPSSAPLPTATQEKSTTVKDSEKTEKTEKPVADPNGKPVLEEGETGILIEGKTGSVLFEKNSQQRMYPASTTKVMTALLALEAVENGTLTMESTITVTEDILAGLDPDGTSIALKPGEIMTLERLLQGLMVASGNDAAVTIATMVSGSKEAFVTRMNERAAELGLTDTHFVNPHGLHDENHYTTAADMAKIAKEAMSMDSFRNIVDIVHIKIPPTNVTEEERYYINTNGLLSMMRHKEYYYPKSTGIKTGYTSEAGNCLVASATDQGIELISVIFGGKGVKRSHSGSIDMLNYGFRNHMAVPMVKKDQIMGEVRVRQAKGRHSVTVSALEKLAVVVPNGTDAKELEVVLQLPESLKAPVTKGEQVGTFSVYLKDQEIGNGLLYADAQVERSFFWPALAIFEWLWSFLLVRIVCGVLVIAAGLFVIVFCLRFYNEIRRARRKKRS